MKLSPTPPLKRSLWMKQVEPGVRPEFPLTENISADVVIIGGGFVGLWTALTIKELEPDCKVVVLEQDVCGGGASGRNGGFVMSWWPKVQSLLKFCDNTQALFLAKAAEKAIFELGEFCSTHSINASFTQRGWLWTATCLAHLDSWEGTLNACARLGERPFERLSRAEVGKRTGSRVHIGGVLEKSNATVQPAALVRGMRRVAIEKGVVIKEGTGVTELRPGSIVEVVTPRGSVKAKRVVLATNAWSTAIPQLGQKIVAVGSSIVATKPMPEKLIEMGWSGGEGITNSQMMVNYYRTTADGRIVFGKGTGNLSYGSKINSVFSEDSSGVALTEDSLRSTYEALSADSIADSWSGPIDRTYDSLPIFGTLKNTDNIFYGIGWSGNGVGPSRLGGRILASLALGRSDQWATCALVNRPSKSFPGEPFRYVGGMLVRSAVLRKEAAELTGRPAHQIDHYLSSLAPAGLEDKS
ncbi:NAD(P)/FAD-dependent oxidoreductase [Pseudomonas sp. O230]|uniref:NAD(P)/FAD-dependent oxidoreductase n=1 Tax=Pseudomonas sp. O230 TaxID=3159450 RepID=UPI00387AFA79